MYLTNSRCSFFFRPRRCPEGESGLLRAEIMQCPCFSSNHSEDLMNVWPGVWTAPGAFFISSSGGSLFIIFRSIQPCDTWGANALVLCDQNGVWIKDATHSMQVGRPMCEHAQKYVYICANMCTYVQTYIGTCVHVCEHAHEHVYTCVDMHRSHRDSLPVLLWAHLTHRTRRSGCPGTRPRCSQLQDNGPWWLPWCLRTLGHGWDWGTARKGSLGGTRDIITAQVLCKGTDTG